MLSPKTLAANLETSHCLNVLVLLSWVIFGKFGIHTGTAELAKLGLDLLKLAEFCEVWLRHPGTAELADF